MGLIAQRFSEVRSVSDWFTRDDDDYGSSTPAGVQVNQRAALGLTTIWRCVDLLTSAVAHAPKDVILKIGGQSFPEYRNRPAWLSAPDPTDPTYTIDDYFSQVILSMLFDGNYFVHVFPYVWDPQVLTVLAPGRVNVKAGPLYELVDQNGRVTRTLGPMEMLHGTWLRPAGALRGISPLEALRRGIGAAIAAEDHAGRFFGQGATLSYGVEVPYAMDKEKKEKLEESMRSKHAGNRNAHRIGVLTDGAKFVTGLAPTPEQAQMLATRKFSVEDLCRPFGVPPEMAGSTEPGSSSYASSETHDAQFKERAVLPLAQRIERQHNRLLAVPDGVNDPNASVQFRFNLDAIARASLLTRYQAYEVGTRSGVLKPNEARAKEDLAPVDGGDEVFMQSQMVPITKLGQDQPAPVPPPGPVRSVERDDVLDLAHTSLDDATRMVASIAAMDAGMAAMEAGAAAAQRHGELLAAIGGIQVSPVVNVPAPVVNVPAAVVNIPAPVVNVPPVDMSPIASAIDRLRQKPVLKRITRDRAGLISSVVEEPLDV